MRKKDRLIRWAEWRWVVVLGIFVLATASIPYLVASSQETPERVFSGCVLLIEDCYSYLDKMRQGAEGAWLFHISYTPEEHMGTLFFLLHLVLGKMAKLLPGANLAGKIVIVYHLARVVFGMGLLLTVYGFLATLTRSMRTRRLAWIIVALGGGFGWLLAALGRVRWLGDVPLDLYFPEGFAFIALSGFPHVSAAQSLLLVGVLCLMRAWRPDVVFSNQQGHPDRHATTAWVGRPTQAGNQMPSRVSIKWAMLTGLIWLLMGLIMPFYVVVAWAVTGGAWMALCLRRRPGFYFRWREALVGGLAALVSAPVVIYSAWAFTSDPVYAAWAAQNQILSPHPLHYLAAYGVPLTLAAFAAKETWQEEGWAWLALSWVAVVPLLSYLPVNIQLRLTTSAQVPLSLLAARGAVRLWQDGRRRLTLSLLLPMTMTSAFITISSSAWMVSRPSPAFRDAGEITVLDWLASRSGDSDTVLTAYETGAYLPTRVNAQVLVGHDLEAVNAKKMHHLVARFFDVTSDSAWRQESLEEYSVDYVFWGPAERNLGEFDPRTAAYLEQVQEAEGYAVFKVKP